MKPTTKLLLLLLIALLAMGCTPVAAQTTTKKHIAAFRRTAYKSKVIRFDYVDTLISNGDKTIVIINKHKKRFVYPAGQSLEIGSIDVYIQN